MEICAVIVVRGGSKRIPRKSMLRLCGETLIARKIRQLSDCKTINRIVLGSDSEEMLAEAKKHGAEVVRRPDFYCDESRASANDMIKNMCELISTDYVVWTHCTNPLISSETYDAAVNTFLENLDSFDSLLSVVNLQEHLWTPDKKPLNYNPYAKRHIPAKELPIYYMQDGGIFIQPYNQMKLNNYFFGNKPYLFVIPHEEFADINTMEDYLYSKFILETMPVTSALTSTNFSGGGVLTSTPSRAENFYSTKQKKHLGKNNFTGMLFVVKKFPQ